KRMLLNYPFPGNIRQLKNFAEQISILESEQNRPVDADVLAKYLPSPKAPNSSTMALTTLGSGPADSFSERELLYKVLFDMRRDMNDLKKLVREVLSNEAYGAQVLNNHRDLFESVGGEGTNDYADASSREPSYARLLPDGTRPNGTVPRPVPPVYDPVPARRNDTEYGHPAVQVYDDADDSDLNEATVEDVSHETEEDDSLSLEKKEKEMIVKALRRNNNKRKYAAQALGISERTLYRKIKQYEIDEE
ncbi:MAG TPA: helix-turn-helix domain-containing protein, partial [Fibrella sp.]